MRRKKRGISLHGEYRCKGQGFIQTPTFTNKPITKYPINHYNSVPNRLGTGTRARVPVRMASSTSTFHPVPVPAPHPEATHFWSRGAVPISNYSTGTQPIQYWYHPQVSVHSLPLSRPRELSNNSSIRYRYRIALVPVFNVTSATQHQQCSGVPFCARLALKTPKYLRNSLLTILIVNISLQQTSGINIIQT